METALNGAPAKPQKRSSAKARKKSPAEAKSRITVALSSKSMDAFHDLKRLTDAYTDSEVVRNALTLNLTLLRAHIAGHKLLIKNTQTGEIETVALFRDIGDSKTEEGAQ